MQILWMTSAGDQSLMRISRELGWRIGYSTLREQSWFRVLAFDVKCLVALLQLLMEGFLSQSFWILSLECC